MKNLYTKSEYIEILKEGETINEGFIGKMFKSLWKGIVKLSKKIRGSKEIQKVYDKYKKLADEAFQRLIKISSASNVADKTEGSAKKDADKTEVSAKKESVVLEDLEQDIDGEENTDKEDANLVNLSPEKINKITKLTNNRIIELKEQFNKEVNMVVNRLSKNPEYSSDKLRQFSVVMRNQFNGYLFDQWYGVYQKTGDNDKLTKLTKIKKENDLKYKQSVEQLNTMLSEKDKKVDIFPGDTYTYYSKSNEQEIPVTVIGKKLGKDEKGKKDEQNPDHDNMWKVKHGDSTFWVSPSSFKSVVNKSGIEEENKERNKEEKK